MGWKETGVFLFWSWKGQSYEDPENVIANFIERPPYTQVTDIGYFFSLIWASRVGRS